MSYKLPELKFEFNGLEPFMDEETVRIHYSKHHQAYVNNLNAALEKHGIESTDLAELLKNVDSLPQDIQQAVINNGGGHYNHTFFWNILTNVEQDKKAISSDLLRDINKNFGSIDEFKAAFEAAGMSRFGSGWVWLVKTDGGQLKIVTMPNQDAPINEGSPLIGVDLWEHSYYLKYQNKRAEYLKNIWNIIDWKEVSRIYEEA